MKVKLHMANRACAISRKLIPSLGKGHLWSKPLIPFSKVSGQARIGADFFHRIGAVSSIDTPLTGMMDDFAVFRRTDFVPEKIHPTIRLFYEQTTSYCLLMHPNWHFGFRFIGKMYKSLSSRLGQLNFPSAAEQHEDLIDHFLPINETQNGRTNGRGCVRTYRNSGATMYVAVFSTHTRGVHTSMDIAFPLPGGNMTFIRRIEAIDMPEGPQGLLLTTLSPSMGDEGVYFVNCILPIRLPIHETLSIRPPSQADTPGRPASDGECCLPEDTLIAHHDIWFFGLKCLTIDYLIFPKASCSKNETRQQSRVIWLSNHKKEC